MLGLAAERWRGEFMRCLIEIPALSRMWLRCHFGDLHTTSLSGQLVMSPLSRYQAHSVDRDSIPPDKPRIVPVGRPPPRQRHSGYGWLLTFEENAGLSSNSLSICCCVYEEYEASAGGGEGGSSRRWVGIRCC